LTLAGVEQASRRFPEPIAVDYLSRLERGSLMPSVPKLATLAHVYQRPLTEFVDLYELENLRELVPAQEGDFWHFRKLGIDYRAQGDPRRSAAAMLRGLDAARASGDIDATAQALTSVGIGLNRLSHYHAAQRFFEEALQLVRDDRIRGYALHNLSLSHYHLGSLFLADTLSAKAEAYIGADRTLWADVRSVRATILADQGRFEEAVKIGREALDRYRELGSTESMSLVMWNIGANQVRAGEVDEGLMTLRESMSLAAETGDPKQRADTAMAYGRSLYHLGRFEDAVSPLRSAFLVARAWEMPQQAFQSAFYLWKLSDERGFQDETDWLEAARRYRPEVEQRSSEVGEFDAWLAQERRKPRPGRKPKNLM
jgi:tetratricopeptide (TPR) repeat protein